ncbi:hypothetical protein BCR43DRAFT_504140 [Syncephalastrum racemosum]|uniref:Uncharacterized protein n=1 Tax=Syncephalastrum racemosum TaxID=13706 RepID=A0A1X2HE39_SYNRA|nr:hypothetical protein BCR43DRAFT_504140 [Syncephalastrum racemosum]
MVFIIGDIFEAQTDPMVSFRGAYVPSVEIRGTIRNTGATLFFSDNKLSLICLELMKKGSCWFVRGKATARTYKFDNTRYGVRMNVQPVYLKESQALDAMTRGLKRSLDGVVEGKYAAWKEGSPRRIETIMGVVMRYVLEDEKNMPFQLELRGQQTRAGLIEHYKDVKLIKLSKAEMLGRQVGVTVINQDEKDGAGSGEPEASTSKKTKGDDAMEE